MPRKTPTDEEQRIMKAAIEIILDRYWKNEIKELENAKQQVWNTVMNCYTHRRPHTGYVQTLTVEQENG